MADRPWKRTERAVARLIGGERVPITGRTRGSAPDCAHPWLAIEVKHRREIPQWLHEALAQARASQRGEQLPVAVLHQSGERHTDDLVVVRLGDFVEWFGDANVLEVEEAAV